MPYAVAVRISSFLYPRGISESTNIPEFYKSLQLDHLTPLGQSIVACLLVFLQANLINRLVTKHRIASANNLIAGMLYILFSSFHPEFLFLTPALLAITFIIISCNIIFKTYKKPSAGIHIFNAAILLGIAGLFHFPSIIYIVFVLISFLILRSIKIKDVFQLILSFGLPFYFYYSISYILRGEIFPIKKETLDYINPSLFSLPNIVDQYILFGAMAIGILVSLFSYSTYVSKKSIQSQKKIDLVYWLLLFSLCVFLLSDKTSFSIHLYAFLPLSILIHQNFIKIRSKIVAELLHLGLIGVLLSLHFVL